MNTGILVYNWDGKAKNRSELAILMGVKLRMIAQCIRELEEQDKLQIGKRRVLMPKEVKLILESYC